MSLEEVLKINEMSNSDLAKELDILRGNVHNWTKGKRKIPLKYMEELCKIFDLPKEFFLRELAEEEKVIVKKKHIERLIDKSSFEYEDTIINEKGEEVVTRAYMDGSTERLLDEYNNEIIKARSIARVIDRVKKTIADSDNEKSIEGMYNAFIDLLEHKNVSKVILNNILTAITIAYDVKEESSDNEFVLKLVGSIKAYEEERQKKKKEIEEMMKSANVEDLFS
jgi:transcriptional regulator with XRE-family HTH domain